MTQINRSIVLNTLIKHETLTITDLAKKENLGMVANESHLNFLLDELVESNHVQTLNGVIPVTYTITVKGIEEGKRLEKVEEKLLPGVTKGVAAINHLGMLILKSVTV